MLCEILDQYAIPADIWLLIYDYNHRHIKIDWIDNFLDLIDYNHVVNQTLYPFINEDHEKKMTLATHPGQTVPFAECRVDRLFGGFLSRPTLKEVQTFVGAQPIASSNIRKLVFETKGRGNGVVYHLSSEVELRPEHQHFVLADVYPPVIKLSILMDDIIVKYHPEKLHTTVQIIDHQQDPQNFATLIITLNIFKSRYF
jgi:hypothetical protein